MSIKAGLFTRVYPSASCRCGASHIAHVDIVKLCATRPDPNPPVARYRLYSSSQVSDAGHCTPCQHPCHPLLCPSHPIPSRAWSRIQFDSIRPDPSWPDPSHPMLSDPIRSRSDLHFCPLDSHRCGVSPGGFFALDGFAPRAPTVLRWEPGGRFCVTWIRPPGSHRSAVGTRGAFLR